MFFNIKIGLYDCDFIDLTMLIKSVKTAFWAEISPECRFFMACQIVLAVIILPPE